MILGDHVYLLTFDLFAFHIGYHVQYIFTYMSSNYIKDENENACTNTSIVDDDIVFDKYLLCYLLSYDVFIMQHGNDRHDSCRNTEYKYCIILFTFVLNII